MKRFIMVSLAAALCLLCTCGEAADPKESTTTAAPETHTALVEAFHFGKAAMEHNDSLGFTWTMERVFGARTLDYLTPQIPEIFETVGIETINEYVIEESIAKYAEFKSLLRCYVIIDKNKGDAVILLCRVKENREAEEVQVSAQVINPVPIIFPASHDGQDDFDFADFDGDGKDELYSMSLDIGADNYHTIFSIFPYEEGVCGAPLFWACRTGEEPLYDTPWGLPFNSGFTIHDKYTLRHEATGYSVKLPEDGYFSDEYDDYSLNNALITEVTVVDVAADGVFEFIIELHPFHWPGHIVSLLKYSAKTKAFETLYTEFQEWTEHPGDEITPAQTYNGFLSRAGYNAGKAVFK